MSTREKALAVLNQYGIPYTLEEHDPVYTMEEMEQLPLEGDGSVVKNLFLKDSKGKRHFLVVLMGHKKFEIVKGNVGNIGSVLCVRSAAPKIFGADQRRRHSFGYCQ